MQQTRIEALQRNRIFGGIRRDMHGIMLRLNVSIRVYLHLSSANPWDLNATRIAIYDLLDIDPGPHTTKE
ncbi:MAG: hypothetical protein OEP48_07060 [Betaproteobacteria bacterium]|nr:hypothetical protein [Betaproteobacteria bacterium]MDH3436500.1 hypothetical protein [Betaproteobacteria bacterium]